MPPTHPNVGTPDFEQRLQKPVNASEAAWMSAGCSQGRRGNGLVGGKAGSKAVNLSDRLVESGRRIFVIHHGQRIRGEGVGC
jgi:hypothetical protein